MTEQQPQIPSAPFPAPPPFWKHFTSENISRLKAIKESSAQAEDRPVELSYLEPPPPPTESYTIFGEEQTLSTHLPSLASLNITQLYPTTTSGGLKHPDYLLLIVRSLHLNFQELCIILSQNPSLIGPKLDDIKNLFQNAHWLINMYRPHQARESLIAMMEGQLDEWRKETDECSKVQSRAEELLGEIERRGKLDGGVDGGGENMDLDGQDTRRTRPLIADARVDCSRRLWKMLTDIEVEADSD